MQIFFHVGMPRAASTFLQYKVFPIMEGIKYIKKHNFKRHEKIISNSKFDKVLLSSEMDIGKKDKRRIYYRGSFIKNRKSVLYN